MWRNSSLPDLPRVYAQYRGYTIGQLACASTTRCWAFVDSTDAVAHVSALEWNGTKWSYVGIGPFKVVTLVCLSTRLCTQIW
jgi:hypothetical protein